jgi:hypothetical protein
MKKILSASQLASNDEIRSAYSTLSQAIRNASFYQPRGILDTLGTASQLVTSVQDLTLENARLQSAIQQLTANQQFAERITLHLNKQIQELTARNAQLTQANDQLAAQLSMAFMIE